MPNAPSGNLRETQGLRKPGVPLRCRLVPELRFLKSKDLVEFKNFGWSKNSHLLCTEKKLCIYIYNIYIYNIYNIHTDLIVYIYIYDNVTQPNL